MSRRKRAYTLIELLVVIAIIATLAAILFPVFAQAKTASRKTVDASNMRQLGLGIRLYADDYDGWMPLTSHDTGLPAWVEEIRPYIAKTDEIKISPADPKGDDRLANLGTSYVLNEYVVPLAYPLEGSQPNLDAMPRPAETHTVFVISDEAGVAETEDHTHSSLWVRLPHRNDWRSVLQDITPDRFNGAGGALDRPMQGTANYLFGDGHVASIPARRVQGWIAQRHNFAIPPSE